MKVRKGSLSSLLLSALEKAIYGFVSFEDMVYHPYKYAYGLNPPSKKSSLSKAVKRLKDGGYIEEIVNEGHVVIKLTNLGESFLGREGEWDGKYRIVIWDIPEKKRRIRDLFRRRLKEWGFRVWQKSVWVSKRNVTESLGELIKELEIDKWVSIIESDDSSLERLVK